MTYENLLHTIGTIILCFGVQFIAVLSLALILLFVCYIDLLVGEIANGNIATSFKAKRTKRKAKRTEKQRLNEEISPFRQ